MLSAVTRSGRAAWLARPRVLPVTRAFSSKFLKISEEVEEAIHAKRPVVALESAIYTHGFPFPENVALAQQVESTVRSAGAIPATIAIIDGLPRVGLNESELAELAASAGKPNTLKVSRRDLAYIAGMRSEGVFYNGGTTIAGTMMLAQMAGIKIFATGGLGGVHRGAEKTFDISADLTELGRTNVAVVSAGSKAFLDLPKTLEYLETQGVFIATFGSRKQKVDFPAFYSRQSGIPSPNVVETPREAASVIHASHSLGIISGQLFCNPIPAKFEIPKAAIDVVIQHAVAKAEAEGITGKDNTPFILSEIKRLSKGSSLAANTALILSNAKVGAEIAVELMELEGKSPVGDSSMAAVPAPVQQNSTETHLRAATYPSSTEFTPPPSPRPAVTPEIVVVGGLAVDTTCTHAPREPTATPPLHTSSPANITSSIGGVAHNIAYATHLLGANTQLITAVAPDASGTWAISELARRGMSTAGIRIVKDSISTAQYVSVNDSQGRLVMAMADMKIMEKKLDPAYITSQLESTIGPKTKWVCLDANLSAETLSAILANLPSHVKVAIDPTSTPKAAVLARLSSSLGVFPNANIHLITPNSGELHNMSKELAPILMDNPAWFPIMDCLSLGETYRNQCEFRFGQNKARWILEEGHLQAAVRLLPVLPTVLVKFGEKGVLGVKLIREGEELEGDSETITVNARQNQFGVKGLWVRYFPVKELVEDVGSVSGAGDTFLGAVLVGLSKGSSLQKCIEFGMDAAAVTVKDVGGVSAEIQTLKLKLLK